MVNPTRNLDRDADGEGDSEGADREDARAPVEDLDPAALPSATSMHFVVLTLLVSTISQALDKKRGTKRADRKVSQTEVRSAPVPALEPDAAEAVRKQLVAGLGAEPGPREAAVVEVVVSVLLRSKPC